MYFRTNTRTNKHNRWEWYEIKIRMKLCASNGMASDQSKVRCCESTICHCTLRSWTSISAHLSSKTRTTWRWPLKAADMRAVTPPCTIVNENIIPSCYDEKEKHQSSLQLFIHPIPRECGDFTHTVRVAFNEALTSFIAATRSVSVCEVQAGFCSALFHVPVLEQQMHRKR